MAVTQEVHMISGTSLNVTQILPKSFKNLPKNPFKIHPNSAKTAPKSLPKSMKNPKRIPNASRMRFFRFFANFWKAQGLPKSSQNRRKSKKNVKKSIAKKHMFLNTDFLRFFVISASENYSKIDVFLHFFRKRRFCENQCFS